jgi:hypothetical protein
VAYTVLVDVLMFDVCCTLFCLQCLRLLRGLTAVRCPSNELLVGKRWPTVNPNAAAIIMDLQATAMVRHPATHAVTYPLCSEHYRSPDLLYCIAVPVLHRIGMPYTATASRPAVASTMATSIERLGVMICLSRL